MTSRPPSPPLLPKERARREILRSAVVGTAVIGFSVLGFIPVARHGESRLRPPGSIDEHEFLAACIKCGQCVQVCPVQAIRLADMTDGFGMGVPHIEARIQACDFSCDAVQCILACPTGALAHTINKKEDVHMGLARLANPEACLARQGEGFRGQARGAAFAGIHRYAEIDRWKPRKVADHPYDVELCDLCVRECPIENAIALEPLSPDPADKRRTPVVKQACTGCGMCEMMCPVESAAIVVDSRRSWGAAS